MGDLIVVGSLGCFRVLLCGFILEVLTAQLDV